MNAADAREILVDLQRAGSEMSADHGEVYLLENVARTERGSHCRSLSVCLSRQLPLNMKMVYAFIINAASPWTGRHVRETETAAAIVAEIEKHDTRWLL